MSGEMSLMDAPENYRDVHQTYLKYMQQLVPQQQWMNNQLGPRLKELFEGKKEIRVLAVGTGTGEVDLDFLNEIVKRGREVRGDGYSVVYQVVEPNPASVEYFKGVVTKDDNYSKVKFEWYLGIFDPFCDEFNKTKTEETKFDFIHFVRVFYYMDSNRCLKRAYDELLSKNGILAVVGENENAFWPKFMVFLADHNFNHEGFTGCGPVSMNYFLPGWKATAEEQGWSHEIHTHKYVFNITQMFDENSRDGNFLVDFAFHGKDCRNTVKKDIMDDFFEFLKKTSIDAEIEVDGKKEKRRHLPCELGCIIITRK